MDIKVNVAGLAEIERKLKSLSEKGMRNAMRRALRKGGNVIRDAARAKARRFDDPATRSSIWENIVVNAGGVKREREAGGPIMRVGVVGGAASGKKLTYSNSKANQKRGIAGMEYSVAHWRFLEFGTSDMQAQPFLRPAAAESAQSAVDAVVAAAPGEIDKELAKLG